MAKRNHIEVGTRVAYSANWLRSTGLFVGPYGFLRGTVVDVEPLGSIKLAIVQWDGVQEPARINVANLAKVGSAAMSAK